MLKNGLLVTHNPGVKYLLEVLKLLYKVSHYLFVRHKFKMSHVVSVINIFLQANKAGRSYKVPLSTFYVEEIPHAVDACQDVALWVEAKIEVKTHTVVTPLFQETACLS